MFRLKFFSFLLKKENLIPSIIKYNPTVKTWRIFAEQKKY